jgi:hypothetical protein
MSCIMHNDAQANRKAQLPLRHTLKSQCTWNQFSCELTLARGAVLETAPSVHITALGTAVPARMEQSCACAYFLLLESERFVHFYHLLLLYRMVLCNVIYFLMDTSNDFVHVYCLLLPVSNVSAQP